MMRDGVGQAVLKNGEREKVRTVFSYDSVSVRNKYAALLTPFLVVSSDGTRTVESASYVHVSFS